MFPRNDIKTLEDLSFFKLNRRNYLSQLQLED